MAGRTFVMAGGGTGGHIIPALAVAEELRAREHTVVFVGTRSGMEAKLVPAAGYPIEWIEIGGLNRVGMVQKLRSLVQLPLSVWRVVGLLGRYRPAAVFSMGGYVAGPVVPAAWLNRVPVVLMEPNAVPGFTNRRSAPFVRKALVNFEETVAYFPAGRAELTGVPVRKDFFNVSRRPAERDCFTILITGGSRGSRTLNMAAQASWPFFKGASLPVSIVHQTGTEAHEEIARRFAQTGLQGEVVPFISQMPAAFAAADLVICRAGASTVSELAAAAKPSLLVPFPFAADDHQLRNAEAMVKAGASRLVLDKEMTGERLFADVLHLFENRSQLQTMSENAARIARPNAASRAADILEEVAG